MRRLIPLLLLLAIGTASASGVLNVLLGTAPPPGILYTGSVTAAANCPNSSDFGYHTGTCGSITPTSDTRGNTPASLDTQGASSFLAISGFSVDPTQSYFVTLVVNGTSYPSSGAIYSYSSGQALWEFTVTKFFLTTGTYAWSYQ